MCGERSNGTHVPTNLQPETCLNRFGHPKNASDRWECELIRRGNIWTDSIPGFCADSSGDVIVGVETDAMCLRSLSGLQWDSIWDVCRDTDGLEISSRTNASSCLFDSTGNSWTLSVPHTCVDGIGHAVGEETQVACLFFQSGYIWTPPLLAFMVGANACRLCDAGRQRHSSGAYCTDCSSGRYSLDGTLCMLCPAGSQPNGTFGAPNCIRCADIDAGTASPDGATCDRCLAGFNPNENATACVECLPGRASLTGAPCYSCIAGSMPSLNRSVCQNCSAGRFSPDGIDCLPDSMCEQLYNGTHVPVALVGADSCLKCGSGKHSTVNEVDWGTHCIACADGQHSALGEECVPCPNGTISVSNRSMCTNCHPGTQASSRKVTQGTSMQFGEATLCHRCSPGLYAEGERDFCRECWLNSAPNVERSFCDCDPGWKFFTQRAGPSDDVMVGDIEYEHSCVDADECSLDNGGCDPYVDCANESPGRSCAPCPDGLTERYSIDWTSAAGNMTCIARPHSGDEQAAALREVTLLMETDDPAVLIEGSPEQAAFFANMRTNLAASLGVDEDAIGFTGLVPAPTERRRLSDPVAFHFSFTIDSPEAAPIMADLQVQLEDPASPLLTGPGMDGLVMDQNTYAMMTVACPDEYVLDPDDNVCERCPLGSGIVDEACFTCIAGYVGDGLNCFWCEPGYEAVTTDHARAFSAGVACKPCHERGLAYATGGSGVFCNKCPYGYEPDFNRTECINCDTFGPGHASDGGECIACASGRAPSADRSDCAQCPPGRASNGTWCEICEAGYFSDGTETVCLPCLVKTYQNDTGQPNCTACPAKSDTRGLVGADHVSWCYCSGNPDIPDAGNYDSGLFPIGPGYDASLLEHVKSEELVKQQLEVLSCWDFGTIGEKADTNELRQQSIGPMCIGCPMSCWNCSAGTGSAPHPMPGYWRKERTSPRAHKCFFPEGCLGGEDSMCNTSYTGMLCASCQPGFKRSLSSCDECPRGFLSFLLAAGTGAAFFTMGIYIIRQNFAAMEPLAVEDVLKAGPMEGESITVSARTLFAFLQLQSLSGDFQLNWPGMVITGNAFLSMVAEPSVFMGFLACLQPTASSAAAKLEATPWPFTRALFVLVVLPVLCWAGPFLYFGGMHIWKLVKGAGDLRTALKKMKAEGSKGAAAQYGDKYTSTVIVLFFVLYPSIVRETLYLLPCIELEPGLPVLRLYPGIECYTAQHNIMILFAVVPSLIVWCAGLPALALLRLWRLSKLPSNECGESDDLACRLDDADIQRKYGFLYRGYERKFYYWELVVS